MRPERQTPQGLTIVIPALNEEKAIGATLSGALAAIPRVLEETGLEQVEIIVVNDGSTDATPEVVRRFPEVRLVDLPKNRGYGGALKAGFQAASQPLLGFMDADGTCDPAFFSQLIQLLRKGNLDIAQGSRLHRESRMPFIRRFGNRFFAKLLSVLSGTSVHDSASGMRLFRREALGWIQLLPDQLNFTPAMSALACFEPRLRLGEIPMPYRDRVGQSKLNVFKDGMRFLRVILGVAFAYAPSRFFATLGLLGLVGALFSVLPVLAGLFLEGGVANLPPGRAPLLLAWMAVGTIGLLFSLWTRHTPSPYQPGCSAGRRSLAKILKPDVKSGAWVFIVLFIGLVFYLIQPGWTPLPMSHKASVAAWSLGGAGLLWMNLFFLDRLRISPQSVHEAHGLEYIQENSEAF